MNESPRRSRIRFGLRTLFELIAVVAFILTLLYYRQTAIQQNDRYQVTTTPGGSVILVDSQTGLVWRQFQETWIAMPEPPKLPK